MSNIIGHLFKIMVVLFYYRIILLNGLTNPQKILYFELKNRKEALQKALEEINQLQSLLPICSACKKVHTDEGYWEQVDDYLLNHSDIRFSHGICPECAAHLYPEYKNNEETKDQDNTDTASSKPSRDN